MLVIAPLINETLIVTVINYYDCDYAQLINFDIVRGFEISTSPLCELSTDQKLLLFGIGPLGNLIIALVLFIGSYLFTRKKLYTKSLPITFAALGFFSSPIFLMLSGEGEIFEVFRLIDDPNLWMLYLLGAILLAISIVYIWSQLEYFHKYSETSRRKKIRKKK